MIMALRMAALLVNEKLEQVDDLTLNLLVRAVVTEKLRREGRLPVAAAHESAA